MFDCTVHRVAHFTHAQCTEQLLPWAVLSFVAAGLRWMEVGGVRLENPGPTLALLPVGATVRFDYSAQRAQWAVVLDLPALTLGARPGEVHLADPQTGEHASLPMFTPIVPEHVSGWEGEFLRLHDAHAAPCAAHRIRVRAGVTNLIRYALDQQPDVYPAPAARLRSLIDRDRMARHSLVELSRQCGYSASRLRVLFERTYGQSPQAYRNKRRMALAADLLCNSDQRIKEISQRVGCRHVSHFSALFRSAFGVTPGAYRQRFVTR